MESLLDVAIRAAQIGGAIISEGAQDLGNLKVEQKSLFDYVSEIDRASEAAIRECILKAYPEHQILGEEYGETSGKVAVQWVVDPLDGTTNFLRGIAHYAVSIGIIVNGELEHGVVYDPAKNEMFTASRGSGAMLNGKAIHVSMISSVQSGLYATGVPFSGDNLRAIDSFTNTMIDILHEHTSGIRRLGSAALDLAYVAAGRYDGYWEPRLKLWDIAAGALLVSEAGGIVSDFLGENEHLKSGNIVAAPIGVHCGLIAITSRHYCK
jgi:myo-inositol-1(or 4)-monophosphatase